MKLILHPEDTGNKNWDKPTQCPIACSLRRAGFDNIGIGTQIWIARKDGQQYIGTISRALNEQAKLWALNPIKQPLEFEL